MIGVFDHRIKTFDSKGKLTIDYKTSSIIILFVLLRVITRVVTRPIKGHCPSMDFFESIQFQLF